MSIFPCIFLAIGVSVISSVASDTESNPPVTCSMESGVDGWLNRYEQHLKTHRSRHRQSRRWMLDSKDKVRHLGKILKCYVQSLRSTANRKVELIFLIDSSASVGEVNFMDELKFVKKLLADFTVDQNNTRVSVITFSSPELVRCHVDHLSHTDDDHHKCSLLDGLHHIGEAYKGGGTFTLGAMLEAKAVLERARPDSKKAVFLITDGYSNYGTPVPVAETLKKNDVEIFTFGIKNGNPSELLHMASEPKLEHTYILDSFEEFEALARRALHEDLRSGTYLKQQRGHCQRLCDDTGGQTDCCDSQALCACGTHTGKYQCMCNPGYYGNGLHGDCKPCPPGTYKNFGGPGDVSVCRRCPDPYHTSKVASTSLYDCRCIGGFRPSKGQALACQANTCPVIHPPSNGYFIRDTCNNVVHAACGIRCNPGYKLRGNSIRLCQENGTWSGTHPTCQIKKCRLLAKPQHGHMMCSKDDFSFETTCQFSCHSGFKLFGTKIRKCLAVAYWNGIPATCKEVRCNPLPDLIDGRVKPKTCTSHSSTFGTRCTFTCHPGYKMEGPYSKQCTEDGSWTPDERLDNKCVDVAAPMLHCPLDIELPADPDENHAEVNWVIPFVLDNSGYLPTVTSIPALTPPARIPIGKMTLTYHAEDNSGNLAKCNFHIHIRDTQQPRRDRCISPAPFIIKHNHGKPLHIDWEEPMFSDNSEEPLQVKRTHKPGENFQDGLTRVTYTATDKSSNNVSCVINIIVKEHACANPIKPVNGDIDCTETSRGLKCSLTCPRGYGFAHPPPRVYYCDFDTGGWTPPERFPFPDCSASENSNNVIKTMEMRFRSVTSCADRLMLNQIETMIHKDVSKRVHKYCEPGILCSVENFSTDCIPDDIDVDNSLEFLINPHDDTIGSRRIKRGLSDWDYQKYTDDSDYDEQEAFAVSEYYEYSPPGALANRHTIKVSFDIAGKITFTIVDREDQDQDHLVEIVEDVSEKVKADLRGGELMALLHEHDLDFEDMTYEDQEPVFTCSLGSVLQNMTCVKCPIGTFFNVMSESCDDCLVGTYQPREGRQTCLWCPAKTSTAKNNSKFVEECKGQCLPGSISADGLEICETCPIGFYQNDYAATNCKPCPEGTTTWRRGARTESQCGVLCPEGRVSKTGLEPCFPCPRGYFQPDRGKSSCYLCPGRVKTNYPGSTRITDCHGITDMSVRNSVGDSIPTSELVINDCFKDPCRNEAKCITLTVGHICECQPGWTGQQCEIEIDECASHPCLNNATCTDFLNGYNCTCPSGFSGSQCEVNLDDCTESSCYNNATCVDGVEGFNCLCATGFSGWQCELNLDDCENNPCGNGTCVDGVASFTCDCHTGFVGENCEVEVDECESYPCYHNATCIDVIQGYTCHCLQGYTGTLCEFGIDECESSPCHNGATCFDLLASYYCRCPPSYTGHNCQEQLSSDFDLVYPASSITDYTLIWPLHQNLTEVSLGFWMKTYDDGGNYGTVISYATEEHDNAFTLMDYSGFVLYINGDQVVTDLVADDSLWHHLYVSWSSANGDWQLYQDGVILESGSGLATGSVILADGALVLGQEQDSIGGGFSAQESFVGNISAVHMWDRNLSVSEIEALVWDCSSQLQGNLVAWPDFLQGLKGRVYKTDKSEFCKGCPEPELLTNGTVTWTGLSQNSQVVYQCDPGFTLVGVSVRECQIDSSWNGTMPTCKRKKCLFPGTVDNAQMTGFYFYGDTVTYTCYRGYGLQGNGSIRCTEEAEWDTALPQCIKIKCPKPPYIRYLETTNTVWTGNYFPGHKLHFTCLRGNTLYGPKLVTCQSDGEWDNPFPSCSQVFCYDPPQIEHAHMMTARSQSINVDSYVQYKCEKGYSMTGLNRILCGEDGHWTDYRPRCEIMRCSDPEDVDFSIKEPDGGNFTYGTFVMYTCLTGHKINGSESLECLESGIWSNTYPTCVPKTCETPENIEDGYAEAETDLLTVGSLLQFHCSPGFEIDGNSTRVCLENETWSGSLPKCQPVKCFPPPTIAYGTYINEMGVYGTTVLYKCRHNYELIGDVILTCNENQTWSGLVPYCVPHNCSELSSIVNGRVVHSGYKVEDTAEYLCNDGYKLVGDGRRECLPNQTWSGTEPRCEYITCPLPPKVEFGKFTGVPPFKPGQVIKYSCESGHEIDGKDTRTCRFDATWSGPTAKCVPVKCKVPKNITNSKIRVEDNIYGSTIEYVCDQGYEITGTPKRTCSEDKDWTGSEPTCGKALCPPPDTTPFGKIVGESHEVGSKVSYECNEGYNLIGLKHLTCLISKRWSGSAPICKPIECDKPSTVISNGKMISTDFTFGSTIHYVCDSGYYIDGPTSRTCLADKSWNSHIPVCDRVECPRPLKPPNCIVDGFDFRYKEHVSYTCRNGYQLVGPNVRTCLADKTWSGSEPKCVQLQCPDPEEPENGRVLTQGTFYENKAIYQCNSGYWLVGNDTRVCARDRSWTGEVPKCVHIVCGKPPEIDGGEPLQSDKPAAGQVVEYKCQTGYVLVDSSNLTCSVTGNYTGSKPRCIKVKCKKLGHIPFGQVWPDGEEFGDAATYMCRPGYKVAGVMFRKCLENGSWSDEEPYCKLIECETPEVIQHGLLNASDGYTYDKVITFSCEDGYDLRGSAERTCLADGHWSGEDPLCEEVLCSPPDIDHGYVTVSAGHQQIKDHVKKLDIFPFGITINFGCEEGFILWGQKELNCLKNKTWDGEIPTCERVKCPAPVIVDSLITATHGYEYQRNIIIDCKLGFKLSGKSILYCNADQTWSDSLPECTPVSCTAPDFMNGNLSVVRSPNRGTGYPFGLTLKFMCYPGYILAGDAISECSENAQWVPDIPTCSQFTCTKPRLPTRARYGLRIISPKEEYHYKEEAEFTCDHGYFINGTKKLSCAENQLWSDGVPECVRVTCDEPTIRNGQYFSYWTAGKPHRFVSGMNLHFKCDTGYDLVGSKNATCQEDSTWSASFPSCVAILCSPLHIDHSEVISRNTGNAYTYGDTATVLCKEGFHLRGTSQLTCAADGSWSAELPYCARIQCTEPSINNGMTEPLKQALTDRFIYNDVIRINCYEGFLLEGFSTLTCTISGQWSHDFPVCEPTTCRQLNLSNGHVSIIEIINPHSDPDNLHVFGTIVQFECDEGYRLIGQNDSVCSEHGTWVGGIPVCEVILCPPLNISNAITNSTLTQYGASVTLTCNPGYQIFGDSLLNCGANGKWRGLLPVCKAITCPTLQFLHGRIVGKTSLLNSFVYGESAVFTCDPGFILRGNNKLVCQQNQIWSSDVPFCERKVCSKAPYSFEHGHILVKSDDTRNNSFNASLTFDCKPGFKLIGQRSVNCNRYGLWSTSFPMCERVFCRTPYLVNGAIRGKPLIGGNYTFGNSITFTCNPGYFLQGETELLCQPRGDWTSLFPVCLRRSCGVPSNPDNGYFNGTSYLFESRVTFHCYTGHHIVGPDFATCLSSGTWSPFPSCDQTKCQMPPRLQNGELSVTGIHYKDIVEYSCINGFNLDGQQTAVCQANGTWSGLPPRCARKECIDWPIIDNGLLSKTQEKYVYGDIAYIICNKGYKLDGYATVKCLESGSWETISSKCVIIKCSYPKRIPNGAVSYTSVTYDSVISYSCDEGYILSGTTEHRCEATGFWSNLQPSCQIVKCPEPKRAEFKNGNVVGTIYTYKSVISYKCNLGYVLHGESIHQCQSTGQWNSSIPRCMPVDCKDAPTIVNGQVRVTSTVYQAVAEYSCNSGYNIRGSAYRTCLFDGSWSGLLTQCEKITCPVPVDIDHGFYSGNDYTFLSEIRYQCKDRFEIEGSVVRVCNHDGKWSGTTPHCRVRKCPPPDRSALDHVVMSSDDFSAGSTISLQCDEGYQLTGAETITCEDGAHWSGNFPRCDRVSCGMPKLDNSIFDGFSYDYDYAIASYKYKDKVEIQCLPGYSIQGVSTLECQADGEWSKNQGGCVPVRCGKPPEITHATIGGENFTFGEYIYYKCEDGFEMTGNNLLQCSNNGSWEGALPSCHIKSCGSVPIIPHASTIISKTTYGSKAMYRCNRGYQIVGSAMAECIANGTWQYENKPKCVPLDCGEPDTLPNGNAKYSGTTLGEYVEYFCDEGYLMVGKAVIRCLPEDGWNSSAPRCLPVSCPTPVVPQYGRIDGQHFEFGNQILYTCTSGYELVGDAIQTCRGDGQWSSRQPRCDVVYCGPPSIPQHGAILYETGHHYGSVVEYRCDPGYHLVGNQSTTCTEEGVWSSGEPTCLHSISGVPCPQPPALPHMQPINTSFLVGDTVQRQCVPGYRASGDLHTVCQEGWTWTTPLGRCTRIKCALPTRDRSMVVTGLSYNHGDTIRYRCRAGLTALTPTTLKCLNNGSWSYQPQCQAQCKFPCQNGGSCVRRNTCKCQAGWSGQYCQQALCSARCKNGGRCSAPYVCTCPQGYAGTRCEHPVCVSGCPNGGRCVRPNRCQCPHGFSPPNCQPS